MATAWAAAGLRAAIFSRFHFMTHINELGEFCGTPKGTLVAHLTKEKTRFTPDGCCIGCCCLFT